MADLAFHFVTGQAVESFGTITAIYVIHLLRPFVRHSICFKACSWLRCNVCLLLVDLTIESLHGLQYQPYKFHIQTFFSKLELHLNRADYNYRDTAVVETLPFISVISDPKITKSWRSWILNLVI